MTIDKNIEAMKESLTSWRHHIHQNPETAFEEHQTSQFVQDKLKSFGIEYHTGLAKTGVVGVLKKGNSDKKIGFRADMDALPIEEMTSCAYKSQTKGKMHACGHDGHTTILLGVAQYLAQYGEFDGTVYFYFQPAEENGGGANVMIQEGLFDKFKPDWVYALHNLPGLEVGKLATREGVIMGAPDVFSITIDGVGGHGAYPHHTKDPIALGALLYSHIQSILSRQINPLDSAVITVAKIHAGDAFNVIPQQAILEGTVRTLESQTQDFIEQQMQNICDGFEQMYGVKVDLDYERTYPVTRNDAEATQRAIESAQEMFGADRVEEAAISMGGEDFSFMLEKVKGCMVFLGNGDSKGLHHPEFDFNDEILTHGVQWFANLAKNHLK